MNYAQNLSGRFCIKKYEVLKIRFIIILIEEKD